MFSRHYVGRDLFNASNYGLRQPVSRITLFVDDDTVVTAGNDTGMELTAKCPYATESMAKSLLSIAKGVQYTAYEATAANLDPAAELGDGVTLDGIYSVLAQISDNGDGYPDISFPGEDLIEEEYPGIETPEENFDRKIATTRSLIAKTAEDIRLSIFGKDGAFTTLSLSLDGLATEVHGEDGAGGLTGQYSAISQKVDNLTIKVVGVDGKETSVKLSDGEINLSGLVTFTALNGENPGTTKINGGWIDADTLTVKAAKIVGDDGENLVDIVGGVVNALGVAATYLRGETVLLKDEDDDISGGIEIRSASTAGYAVDLWSYGSLSVDAVGGSLYLGAEDGYIAIEEVGNYGYQISCGVDVIPSIPGGSLDLGHYYYQWGNIYSTQTYAEAAEADTSDRNKKNSITYDLDRYDPFFDRLLPAAFKLNNGTSGRLHTALVAQDVEQALAESGIPTSDFAGFIKIEDSYALRYGEFIALLIWQVQKLKARVAQLEEHL